MQVRKEEKHVVLRKSICTGKACIWNVKCFIILDECNHGHGILRNVTPIVG
jgi:uncharacterized protein (DUF433 family)